MLSNICTRRLYDRIMLRYVLKGKSKIEEMKSNESSTGEDSQEGKKGCRTIIKEFCEYTSFGGLGRVVGAKQFAHKVVWLFLFTGGFIYAGAQLHDLFTKYQSRPISTSIHIETEVTLPFPTVTFCNFNPIRKSRLSALPKSVKQTMIDFTNPNKTYDELDVFKYEEILMDEDEDLLTEEGGINEDKPQYTKTVQTTIKPSTSKIDSRTTTKHQINSSIEPSSSTPKTNDTTRLSTEKANDTTRLLTENAHGTSAWSAMSRGSVILPSNTLKANSQSNLGTVPLVTEANTASVILMTTKSTLQSTYKQSSIASMISVSLESATGSSSSIDGSAIRNTDEQHPVTEPTSEPSENQQSESSYEDSDETDPADDYQDQSDDGPDNDEPVNNNLQSSGLLQNLASILLPHPVSLASGQGTTLDRGFLSTTVVPSQLSLKTYTWSTSTPSLPNVGLSTKGREISTDILVTSIYNTTPHGAHAAKSTIADEAGNNVTRNVADGTQDQEGLLLDNDLQDVPLDDHEDMHPPPKDIPADDQDEASPPEHQDEDIPPEDQDEAHEERPVPPEEPNEDEEDRSEDDMTEDDFADPDELKPEYKSMAKIGIILASTAAEKLKPLGHQFNETIIDCSYRGFDCKKKHKDHWKSFWHYKYGNCFSFNVADTGASVRSNKPGPFDGLSIKLNIDQANYVDQLTQEAGFRVLISPQGPMPFPFEEGISVAPGYSANIGLRKVEIIRVDPFNNRSCMPNDEMEDAFNLYSNFFNSTYSKTACKESCLAYNQLKYCKCMEFRFPVKRGIKVCNVLNSTVVKCLNKVQKKFRENTLNCSMECPPPCLEEYFQLSTSLSAWPSENYESYLVRDLTKLAGIGKEADVRSNILRVRIFYEEFNYEVITETVSYELVDFVSDIGGQLGLWLGVSVLTGAEVIELLLLLFYQLFIPPKKQEKKGTDTERGQRPTNDANRLGLIPMEKIKFNNYDPTFSPSAALHEKAFKNGNMSTKQGMFPPAGNIKYNPVFIDSVS